MKRDEVERKLKNLRLERHELECKWNLGMTITDDEQDRLDIIGLAIEQTEELLDYMSLMDIDEYEFGVD